MVQKPDALFSSTPRVSLMTAVCCSLLWNDDLKIMIVSANCNALNRLTSNVTRTIVVHLSLEVTEQNVGGCRVQWRGKPGNRSAHTCEDVEGGTICLNDGPSNDDELLELLFSASPQTSGRWGAAVPPVCWQVPVVICRAACNWLAGWGNFDKLHHCVVPYARLLCRRTEQLGCRCPVSISGLITVAWRPPSPHPVALLKTISAAKAGFDIHPRRSNILNINIY